MTGTRPPPGQLELEIYDQSQSGLRQLAGQLPGQRLANFAREVLVNVAQRGADLPQSVDNPTPDQISELSHALIDADDHAGARFIQGVQADGASPDVVYLKYLAAAARMLGVWWEEDKVTFVAVTLGTNRIFSIMRAMRGFFAPRDLPLRKSAVFAAIPGEDHTVGIRMATDLFRQDGWTIDLKVGLSQAELIRQTDWARTHIIGLTYGGQHSFDALTRLIVALKIHAPAATFFVGGQDVSEIEPVAKTLGVDATSDDVKEGLKILNATWESTRRNSQSSS